MKPGGPLSIEHRLIERMVRLLADELRAMIHEKYRRLVEENEKALAR